MKIVLRLIGCKYRKIDRHLHSALALKNNFVLVYFSSYFFHFFYSVINGLRSFEPFIEEPVKINMCKLNDRIAEIFGIWMTEFPLLKIIFHCGLELAFA